MRDNFLTRQARNLIGHIRSLARGVRKAIDARRLLQTAVDLAAADAAVPSRFRSIGEGPVLSLVTPVYNTPPAYLDDLVRSFAQQEPGLAELILSDDGSTDPRTIRALEALEGRPGIVVVRSARNQGISAASNAAISVAQAPWIGFIDHDDALAPHAVRQIVQALATHPECAFLYTDELIGDAHLRLIDYFLKPAFDPVLLSGVNYINHFSIYRRDRVQEIGGLRLGFEGSQDYDLLLRYLAGIDEGKVLHLPYPAYIWRRDGRSYSARQLDKATRHARKALEEAYAPKHGPVSVGPALAPALHRVQFSMPPGGWPHVSIIIPSRNQHHHISRVLDGIFSRTDYPNLDVIVIDNGSTEEAVLDLYARYRQSPGFRAEIHVEPFNFARSINRGIRFARPGAHLLWLNNDIEIESADWLKEMVACTAYAGTGIVGAKLLYPDRTTQHLGVVAGFGGYAGHWYLGEDEAYFGPLNRFAVRQSLSCVTGACLLVTPECSERVGLLDEERFAIAYNDIDYCLRARRAGFRVVWTPFSSLVHHESASRGSDETPENAERFRREKAQLAARHHTTDLHDPAINPWYSRDRSYPTPVRLTKIPKARSNALPITEDQARQDTGSA